MFGFLKDKLKGALKIFSKGVDEKGKTEEKTIEVEEEIKPVLKKEKSVEVIKSKPVAQPELKKSSSEKIIPKAKPVPVKQIQDDEADEKPVEKKEETISKLEIEEVLTRNKDELPKFPLEEDIIILKDSAIIKESPLTIVDVADPSKEPISTTIKVKVEQTNSPSVVEDVLEEKTIESKEYVKDERAVEEIIEEAIEPVKEVEKPKSLFSKFKSVFKKESTDADTQKKVEAKKKESPKTIIESTRITPDGKIIEEKTIVQHKDEPEVNDEKKIIPAVKPKPVVEPETVKEVVEEKPKSFFAKFTQVITTKTISLDQFDELFFELEVAMLENNVAVQVIEKLKTDLQKSIVGVPIKRGDIEQKIIDTLRVSVTEVLSIPVPDLLELTEAKKPYIIAFIGVNGAGKTTNLAKVANYFKKHNKSVVIAACDTFRAAAIHQLEEHANNLDIKIIKQDYGADAAAVAFDAVAHAKSKGIDVVLIDTAGRLHSNSNLMDELAKIERVIKPDLKLFVGESVTGNDCIEQAMQFNEKIGIDGIILSKADVDEKGGAAISVSYVTQKPIFFIGTGQKYDDLEAFSKDKVLASLDL